jgi:DNA-binding NtrC family response regulator
MAQQSSFLIASADDATASALEAMLFETGARGRRVSSAAEAFAALDLGSYDVLIADVALTICRPPSCPPRSCGAVTICR